MSMRTQKLLLRLSMIALLALTGACASVDMIPGPAPAGSVQPALAQDHFTADDGAELPLRVWLPEGKTTAMILAIHGFNDYSNAFAGPAADWAKDGIATYAYDQRGFGAAPMHGFWAGSARLATDLAEASRVLRARHPGVPLYILGESMGGAVAIVAMSGIDGTPRPEADGIILSAPAVWGRDTMNAFERVGLWVGYRTFPGMTFTGKGFGIKPSDNIEMLRALSRDPLVIKETRVDAIKGLVDLMDEAQEGASKLDLPMLLIYGQHDELIPKEPIRRFIAHLPPDGGTARRIAWYPNGYHMLMRDLDAATVNRDIAAWIENVRAPLPSGADRNAKDGLIAAR